MGFYIDMNRLPQGGEFREAGTPPVFWFLYLFAGFALTCMGGAAYAVLGDLIAKGSSFDRALVWAILSALPLYFLLGAKLAGVRKFVRFRGNELEVGYLLLGRFPFLVRRIPRESLTGVELVNRRPSPNVAANHHDDRQYHIRGHWRVVALRRGKRPVTLDKHTERGALARLYDDLQQWLGRAG